MTGGEPHSDDADARPAASSPRVAWPARISHEDALAWVRRRLPEAEGFTAELYHHPMLGVQFRWVRPKAGASHAHALVDMVGGRAYAAEPWDDVDLQPLHGADRPGQLRDPAPAIGVETALESARRLMNSVLLRRRRAERSGRLELLGEPVLFGKPNWWIAGSHRGRRLEVTLDAVTGRHYVFSA